MHLVGNLGPARSSVGLVSKIDVYTLWHLCQGVCAACSVARFMEIISAVPMLACCCIHLHFVWLPATAAPVSASQPARHPRLHHKQAKPTDCPYFFCVACLVFNFQVDKLK